MTHAASSHQGYQKATMGQRADEMYDAAARSARDGADAASALYDNQPLVMAALAFAVGAAIGGALPRTRRENALMGSLSDDLFDEAERIYHEERSKVMAVAQSVRDEVSNIASETKADLDSGAPGDMTAAEALAEKAKILANRVTETAKDTADREDLGKPLK